MQRKKLYERSETENKPNIDSIKKDVLKSIEDMIPMKIIPLKKNNEPTINSFTNIKKVNFEIIQKNNMSFYNLI
jgi:hypothetical protein